MEFVAEVHYPTVAIIIQIVDGVAVFFFRERIYRVLQVEQFFYFISAWQPPFQSYSVLLNKNALSYRDSVTRFSAPNFFYNTTAHYEQSKKVALFVMFCKYLREIQIFAILFLL